MKKICILVLLIAFLGLGLVACDNRERLYVFNWGDFMCDELLRQFEREYGVRIIFADYGSNEEMYTRMVVGGGLFDIIIPSDYMIERLIAEGRLRQINWDNVPNIRYIFPWILERSEAFDPGLLYSVPYKWGTFGILYNTTMVDQPVYSWSILWDPQFADQVFLYDIARDTFGAAQKKLGISLNSTDHDELMMARDALLELRPRVRAFLQDPIKDSMIGREGALATVFNGCAMWSISQNDELNYVVPIEGTQLWINAMVIPANAPNPELAEAFLNFMSRPDVALQNTLFTGFATTNHAAFDELPEDWRNNPIYWPTQEAIDASEVFVDLGPFREYLERAWTEVRAGN